MRISNKGDYALKSVLELSQRYGKGVLSINDLSSKIHAPKKFLERILVDLKKGGFVESRRGNEGGYTLARPPAQIRLGDVVQFIDGPVDPIPCVKECYTDCEDRETCVFRDIWQEVSHVTLGIINAVTFEDLVNKARSHKEAIAYVI